MVQILGLDMNLEFTNQAQKHRLFSIGLSISQQAMLIEMLLEVTINTTKQYLLHFDIPAN